MGQTVRKVVRVVWVIVCTGILLSIPLCVWELHRKHYELHTLAWFVAGIFVLLAVPMSLWEVHQHLECWTCPKEQRHILRILWMVPIYAFESWLALRFKDAALYLDTARECYEAYVIYNFYQFLIVYLEKHEGHLDVLLAAKPQLKHLWPMNHVLREWKMGAPFLRRCKAGVFNYIVFRPLTTLVACISEWRGVYGDGGMDPRNTYIYCTIVNNFSQCAALYCLMMFYLATKDELAPIKPLAKFLCVKAVVFFSFWQSMAILILVRLKVITSRNAWTEYDVQDVAVGMQDFLVCVEMFFAAIAHAYAFSPREYRDPNLTPRPLLRSISDMFDVGDVYQDFKAQAERGELRLRRLRAHGNQWLGRELSEHELSLLEQEQREMQEVSSPDKHKLLTREGEASSGELKASPSGADELEGVAWSEPDRIYNL